MGGARSDRTEVQAAVGGHKLPNSLQRRYCDAAAAKKVCKTVVDAGTACPTVANARGGEDGCRGYCDTSISKCAAAPCAANTGENDKVRAASHPADPPIITTDLGCPPPEH